MAVLESVLRLLRFLTDFVVRDDIELVEGSKGADVIGNGRECNFIVGVEFCCLVVNIECGDCNRNLFLPGIWCEDTVDALFPRCLFAVRINLVEHPMSDVALRLNVFFPGSLPICACTYHGCNIFRS